MLIVCLGFEPGAAGLRHRRIHWAMVAPQLKFFRTPECLYHKDVCEIPKALM